jgi:hypothetical protein
MRQAAAVGFLLVTGLAVSAQTQIRSKAAPNSSDAPLYRISFDRKDPVAGIDAPPLLKLPFDCTTDGTAFVTMLPTGGLMQPPLLTPPPLLLVSVPLSGQAHTFPIDQPTQQLYNVREIDHYASESTVIFLVQGSDENKPVNRTYTKPDGTPAEYSDNSAERRLYLLWFDRDGNYKKTAKLDIGFRPLHIGVFPSGTILTFGYDEKDQSPKLALLREDGTFLRFLEVRKGDAPESMFGKDGSGKGPAAYIAPAEFVPFGHSIVLVQNKSDFPLLQIDEGGNIRAVRPRLPKGVKVEGLIASDQNLYLRVSPTDEGSIYEITPGGSVLRRFELVEGHSAGGVACVHDGKFLSFDNGEGKLVPLIGKAEPVSVSD